MKNGEATLDTVYSTVFEAALLKELEEKSMLITASPGGLIKMGQQLTWFQWF